MIHSVQNPGDPPQPDRTNLVADYSCGEDGAEIYTMVQEIENEDVMCRLAVYKKGG